MNVYLNKEYKSKTGAIRVPLYFSDCGRFVTCKVTYTNSKELKKIYWSIMFTDRVKRNKWKLIN